MKTTTCKIHTAKPRSLQSAKAMRDFILSAQSDRTPLRFWPVVIPAETDGYHVCDAGFATSNGLEIIR